MWMFSSARRVLLFLFSTTNNTNLTNVFCLSQSPSLVELATPSWRFVWFVFVKNSMLFFFRPRIERIERIEGLYFFFLILQQDMWKCVNAYIIIEELPAFGIFCWKSLFFSNSLPIFARSYAVLWTHIFYNKTVMGTYINIGNAGFQCARNSGYVDKSGLIAVVNSSALSAGRSDLRLWSEDAFSVIWG